MTTLENALAVFKILPRTNCRDCAVPTCFAFAAAAFKGDKSLADCPHLESSILDEFVIGNDESRTLENEEKRTVGELGSRIRKLDFEEVTARIGATILNDKLAIPVLGKNFFVDKAGKITSDCHVHGWISIPILNYVLSCRGETITGNWVHLRDLKDGAPWEGLFNQRCEKPLKKVADNFTDLFEHMVQVFSAKRTTNLFGSDVSIVMEPLPKVPMLICYWKPDGDLESSINIFFDDSANHNTDVDSLYRLAAGIALMFEKIAITHG